MARFEIFKEGKKLLDYEIIGAELIIGRDTTVGLRLDDPLVSRRHARVFAADGAFHIEDKGASNGLFVNGVREYRKPLRDGDRIELGSHVLTYRQDASEAIAMDDELVTGDNLPAVDDFDETGMQTQHISPAEMARLRRQVQSQMEPHLIQERVRPERIHPLKHSRNVIGTADSCELRIPEVEGKQVAALERVPDGGFILKKTGLLGTLKVNGQKVRDHMLRDGDKIEIGNAAFTYRAGG
jgi:pSer/pThr/pTyr-binding forkhead associated (FHA) protein